MTRRGLAILALTMLALPSLGGCASGPSTSGPDVMSGRTVEMFVERAGRRYERYLVGTDGVLHFAGGADAHQSNYTWSGPLTTAEIDELAALVARHGWRDADPASTGVPSDVVYTVVLRDPGVRRSFTVKGDPPAVADVRRLLDAAARRRLDAELDALPKSGLQK